MPPAPFPKLLGCELPFRWDFWESLLRRTVAARASGFTTPALKPNGEEGLEPRRDPSVVLEPASEMLWPPLSAGPGQALSAAVRPPAHHVIGDLGVELEGHRAPAVSKRLIREI